MDIVIDSLSRSGTTLLTSILGSTQDAIALRGGFNELLSAFDTRSRWPANCVKTPILEERVTVKHARSRLSKILGQFFSSKSLALDYSFILAFGLHNFQARNQFAKISEAEIERLVDQYSSKEASLRSLDSLYRDIRHVSDCKCFLQRWNNCIAYAPNWIDRENHFWLHIIRDPVEAALSRKKAFGTSLAESLEFEIRYSEKRMRLLESSAFKILYFDDLVNQADVEIAAISKWCGFEFDNLTDRILGTDGLVYRSESTQIEGSDRLAGRVEPFINKQYLKKRSDSDPRLRDSFAKQLANDPILQRYF